MDGCTETSPCATLSVLEQEERLDHVVHQCKKAEMIEVKLDRGVRVPAISSKNAGTSSEMLGVDKFLCKISKLLQYGQLTSLQLMQPKLELSQEACFSVVLGSPGESHDEKNAERSQGSDVQAGKSTRFGPIELITRAGSSSVVNSPHGTQIPFPQPPYFTTVIPVRSGPPASATAVTSLGPKVHGQKDTFWVEDRTTTKASERTRTTGT